MTIPRLLLEDPRPDRRSDARRAYAAIFRPSGAVVYAALRTPRGWRTITDPARDAPPPGATLAVTLCGPAEGRRVFDALAEGGAIETPFQPSAWSPGFARLTDRWRTGWMLDSLPAPRGGA
ncbi:hypothetical protein [Rubellimicrobium aerolatum]|uniref:VOC family protein n=1 Tax=Rubellimicrobium aerolatum TaxID=490979 RepID=A0ABW0SG95_9RHOB|nr:hypothetical protein [Rubellimicrobium aerolatum]MBP1807348.1 putative glyoxalase superfamily protein PhnB [Rubellimicrobium aerolatum]